MRRNAGDQQDPSINVYPLPHFKNRIYVKNCMGYCMIIGFCLNANRNQKALIESGRADKKTAKDEVATIADELLKLREYVEKQLDSLNKLLGGYENWLYSPYIGYAKKAAEYFFSQLPSGILYNDLLISQTDQMVRNSAEAREYLGRKFKCIYVDEFQDTDHVQERLIRTICLDETGLFALW